MSVECHVAVAWQAFTTRHVRLTPSTKPWIIKTKLSKCFFPDFFRKQLLISAGLRPHVTAFSNYENKQVAFCVVSRGNQSLC